MGKILNKGIVRGICFAAVLSLTTAFLPGCQANTGSDKGKKGSEKKEESSVNNADNLIKGGDFTDGKGNFSLYTNGGKADMDVNEDGELQLDITGIGGVEHGVQVFYDGFKIYKGGKYKLEFDVHSTIERDFDWRIQINGGDYHAYADGTITANEEVQHVESEFTMEEDSDPAPRFCFNLGLVKSIKDTGKRSADLGEHSMMFDNISLVVVDDSSMIKPEEGPEISQVKINQLGYLEDSEKVAVFSDLDEADDSFSVVNTETDETVFEGEITDRTENKDAGEFNSYGDFSEVKEEGTYKIVTKDGVESYEFKIGNDVYEQAYIDSMKMLYLQRCGVELDSEHAGDFAHDKCHDSKATIYDTNKKIDVSGGWHDAGDYGRYTVSGCKAVADLLLAYENFSEDDSDEMAKYVNSDDIGIPESGNDVPDILDEAKFELDWLLKMQADNGGVYHKVTCKMFPEVVMPEEETDELVVCKVSNTATLDFAAVMAMASETYRDVDKDYADKCLKAAEKAFDFYKKKGMDIICFVNPPDITTGEYKDGGYYDEAFFAAVELYKVTEDKKYLKEIKECIETTNSLYGFGWMYVGYYGWVDILKSDVFEKADSDLVKLASDTVIEAADDMVENCDENFFNINVKDGNYIWGSNMDILNSGMLLEMAYDLTENDEKYEKYAKDSVNYVFGTNAVGYSFVTGTGTLSPEHTHHRPSQYLEQTMPGMLVGGVDSALEDPYAKGVLSESPDAKCYVDNDQSFSCNEVTVYWNSPLIYMINSMID
ncbi:MAG: glycoside hydrolase family 9 protein [Lachnospiraceae bacterium]|nr:glycoside hydrolase family 9 protein [Lachnospiraceae bacterium]